MKSVPRKASLWKTKSAALIFLMTISVFLLGCRRSAVLSVDIIGSTTVSPLMEHLVSVYLANHSGRFLVQSLGSSMGIVSVRDGYTSLGMSSRSLTNEEKNAGVLEHHIATEAIAIAVNIDNPVENLTNEQLTNIFNGTIVNWKDVGGFDKSIVVVSREAGSGARVTFEKLLSLQNIDGESLVDDVSFLVIGDGTGQVRANVASRLEAIGYMSISVIDGIHLKALSIDGVSPSVENIQTGVYSLTEPLYLLTRVHCDQLVEHFLSWVLSSEGQVEVERFGLVGVGI